MGSGSSVFEEEQLDTYEELTYFNRKQIINCYKRYRDLFEGDDHEKVDADPNDPSINLPIEIVQSIPELEFNPFAERLCRVFSSDPEKRFMSFEDFLDMFSILSSHTPPEVKADWAFKVYDFDEDGEIGDNDIRELIKLMTDNYLNENDFDQVFQNIMQEGDFNRSSTLSPFAFRYIMGRSPDFAQNFSLAMKSY